MEIVKIGVDARVYTGYWRSRGIARFTREFLLNSYDNIGWHLFVPKASSENESTLIKIGLKFYPYWENVVLPLALFRYKCEIGVFPMNTMPIFFFRKILKIIVIHDVIPIEFKNNKKVELSSFQKLNYLYRRFVFSLNIKSANYVVTVSNYSKSQILLNSKIDSNKIFVIQNTLTDNWFFERIKYPKKKSLLCVTGNIPSKNLLRTLEAFSNFSNSNDSFSLDLLGIKDTDAEMVFDILLSLGIEKRVNILKQLNDLELRHLYASSWGLVSFSIIEGFGIPLIEAMASGTLIACSNTSSYPEVVGSLAFLADPFNVKEMTSAISKLCEVENDEYARISELSFNRAFELFSRKVFQSKIDNFWKKVIES